MDGKNVLSLVLEIDCAKYIPGVQLVGVVAETLTRGSTTSESSGSAGPR